MKTKKILWQEWNEQRLINITGIMIMKRRKPVKPKSFKEFTRFDKGHRRRVRAHYEGDYFISTVFMAVNMAISEKEPIHFETMIFKNGDMMGEYQTRCATHRQALAMHKAARQLVKFKAV